MKGYVISFRNVHSRLVHNISVEWLSTYADGGLTDADVEAYYTLGFIISKIQSFLFSQLIKKV